jgi:choloylglycine hydrolase
MQSPVYFFIMWNTTQKGGRNMCTAVSYLSGDHYFGRNLDLEYSYNETVTITPRQFAFHFRKVSDMNRHFAMIGMATVADGYPLYYDATNEYGLSMAGLNFPGNAVYFPEKQDKNNITPFEFIPWILGQCKTVAQVREILPELNLVNMPFSEAFPLSPLHWIISDKKESIVVEPTAAGIDVYDNPVGILTNNPPFSFHMYNLSNYLNLTHEEPVNRLTNQIDLAPYSRGMGAIGLPGDLSSASRFIKAAFTKLNSISDGTQPGDISQFFHILGSVAQQNGCVKVNGAFEKTVYSSCCNTDQCIYYYTTYENSQITGINMKHEDLDADTLRCFSLITQQQIRYEN